MSATTRWVRKKFRRETFVRKSLSAMLEREDVHRSASGTKKIRKTVRPKSGMFWRMERELAWWVRETRGIGILVESFMLAIEEACIMKQFYSDQFNEYGTCKFRFSNGWRAN